MRDKEVEYIFKELRYYALLKENGNAGEEVGPVDNVWIASDATDIELAEAFKRNAKILESDIVHAQSNNNSNEHVMSAGFQSVVDPFMYAFSADHSQLFAKPVTTPEDSLNQELPRSSPGSPEDWLHEIEAYNTTLTKLRKDFDKRKFSELVRAGMAADRGEEYLCWLPTDFHVSEDGSVYIPSYINNLHPIRHAELYKTIFRVFAKFVPLLEQVTTDIIHPRSSRAEFSRELCLSPGMLSAAELLQLETQGKQIPEEYQKYFVPEKRMYGYFTDDDAEQAMVLDSRSLSEDYKSSMIYTDPEPKPFSLPDRPLKPYSMRGLPLQASVDMASIHLTSSNSVYPEDEWQAVGRAEERIFAVGLYFYDVENIASAKLNFRDPVRPQQFRDNEEMQEFLLSHVTEEVVLEDDYRYYKDLTCLYTQEVGGVEIKNGSY
ncbi:hypothetical protein IWW38_002014, partial [Coemansia aciculifera]